MADKLTPEQEMAVKNRGGKLLVSAAAGSGKTKVLIDRLLGYIMDKTDPANVDEFLMITYTKAAAAELRGKISAKLTEKIAEQPENYHLQQQVQRLYLAKISTVHAFCGDILREYAYKLDIPSDFRVADEAECHELQMEILEKLLEDSYETSENNPEFCAFIDTQGFGRDDRKIPEIILKVYNSARCHLSPQKWLTWCVSSGETHELQDAGQTIWGRYIIDDFHHYLDLQTDAMQRCAEMADENGTMPKPAGLLVDAVAQLKDLRKCDTWDEIMKYPKIEYGTMRFPKSCTDMELVSHIKAIRDACKKGVDAKRKAFTESSAHILSDLQISTLAAKGLVSLVYGFADAYEKQKQSRRILDFGDLEHKTLDLLLGKSRNGITAAAQEIGRRFREIMVDEYQDSNGVQDAIFEALTREKKNCFMVGDVKQSIYQFRLADPGIFLEKYHSYYPAETASEGQGRKVMLSKNFRSSGGVISAVNDVFTYCMSANVGGLAYGADEMLYEGLPHEALNEPEVALYGISVREDTYAEEASFTASKIRELLDGKHMVRGSDGLRPIRESDIAILLRSPGSVGGEFRYALERAGIPCTTGDSSDLLQAEEIQTLNALLQIISNPLQDIPLLAVLASPVFGFTADELADFRGKNKKCAIYEALKWDTCAKSQNFITVLDRLRNAARLYTVSQLLENIFQETDFVHVFSAMSDGVVREANLEMFFQIASSFENGGKKDLFHFLRYLEMAAQKGLVVSGDQTGAGCVTIMSIHKSKGLEFPVVFLCGLSRNFNRESFQEQVLCHKQLGLGLCCVNEELRVRYPNIAKRAIAAMMKQESISEELRVLYVAMTRARDRLIMTYAAPNLEDVLSGIAMRMDLSGKELLTGEVNCPGSWVLQTALQRTEAGEFFALGGHPECARVSDVPWEIRVVSGQDEVGAAVESTQKETELSDDLVRYIESGLSFRYPHSEAVNTPSKLTATQLKGRDKDQEASENTRQIFAGEFRKPGKKRQSGKNYGTAMHTVMQFIRFDKCKTADAVRMEVIRLQNEEQISAEQASVINCEQIAAFFQSDLGQKLINGGNVLREFKFSILMDAQKYYPEVMGEKVLLQGVVDCALISENGIEIIDFKTDHIGPNGEISRIESYKNQLGAYGDALSRIFEKPVIASYLYFFHNNQFVKL